MLLHLRRHAIAYLALFLVLGGTSFAATKLGKGSVTNSKLGKGSVSNSKLRRGSVTNSKLAANSVTGGKVKNGALTSADFAKGTLLRGATGAKGDKGDTGPSTGPAGGDLQGTYPNPTIKPLGDWTALSPGLCRIIMNTAGWTNGANGTNPIAYRLDRDGVVHLRGGVLCPKVSNTSSLTALPAEARPLKEEFIPINASNAAGLPASAYTHISPDGTLLVVSSATAAINDFYSLDGVEYDTKH
jgi:hypothetical protein